MSNYPHQNPYQDPYRNPYQSPFASAQGSGTPRRHAILGIIATVMGVVGGLGVLGDVVAAVAIEINTPGGMDEDSPVAILIGLVIFACLLLNLVGLGLAIGSFFQRDTQKLFGILGIVFNTVSLLNVCGILCLGILAA